VVFDGYGQPSVKDHEHRRRCSKISKTAPAVQLEATKQILFEQQQFMANSQNKVAFIEMLKRAFNAAGLRTHQSQGDADTDIVSIALKLALSGSCAVVVYGDDTDILSMLLFHRSQHMSDIFFWSERTKLQHLESALMLDFFRTNSDMTSASNFLYCMLLVGVTPRQQFLVMEKEQFSQNSAATVL